MIAFNCPRCGTVYRVPDNRAGKQSSCSRCHQRLIVPAALTAIPVTTTPPTGGAPVSLRSRFPPGLLLGVGLCGSACIALVLCIVYVAYHNSHPTPVDVFPGASSDRPSDEGRSAVPRRGERPPRVAASRPPEEEEDAPAGPRHLTAAQRARWRRIRREADASNGYVVLIYHPDRDGWVARDADSVLRRNDEFPENLNPSDEQTSVETAEEQCNESHSATAVIDLFSREEPRLVCWFYSNRDTGATRRDNRPPPGTIGTDLQAFLRRLESRATER
jgi:hypothetical protein